MPYNANIPQATDVLSQSQADILANFQDIFTLVGVNHVNFGAVGAGKHNFVTMPVQGASPATIAGELALFSRTSAITGNPAMAWRQQTNGAVIEFTSAGSLVSGWFITPSGITVKWGTASATGAAAVNFPTIDGGGQAIPAFTLAPVNIQFSPIGGGDTFVSLVSATNLLMNVNCTARTSTSAVLVNFSWLAIGV